MSFMLRRIYDGFLFKADRFKTNPYVGIVILIIQFTFMIPNINWILGLLLVFIIVENIFYRNIRGALSLLYSIIPIIIILGGLSYLFGGWVQLYRVMMRFLIGALGFSFFFASTNPSDLTRSLENLKLGSKLAFLPSLALVIIPRIAKDSEDTFNTLKLRGEIRGSIFRWLPKTLAILIASVIYRSEFLAQSLYFRGFGIQKRTHYKSTVFSISDVLRLIIWFLFLVLIFVFDIFKLLNFLI